MCPIPDPGSVPSSSQPSLAQALESKRATLEAMPEASVLEAPGVDAPTASSVVVGAIARIQPHRAAIVAQYGEAGAHILDDLGVVAAACEQANIEATAAPSDADLREAHEGVLEELELIENDLDGAANRKLIDRARIDAGRARQGYRTVVQSTLVLVALAREVWPKLEGKVPMTRADLDRAERKAQDQLKRINEREQGVTRLPAVELRRRALSLLLRTYGEARRMITYVRWWEGDADAIAPSVWSGRRRKSREEDVTDPVVAPPAPPAPSPGPSDPSGPFTS